MDLNLREDLSWEVVVTSGLVLAALGAIWNYFESRRPEKPDPRYPDLPGATGGHRTSYIMMLVGGLWACYGILLGLGL